MSTLAEISDLANDPVLLARVKSALIYVCNDIAAATIGGIVADGTGLNTNKHRLWARYCLDRPADEARKTWNLVLADVQKAKTVAEIQALTDNQIQNRVNAIMPYLVLARSDR